MSHFTVLVVGENIDTQLAPFQENNMGDCPKEYLKFFDVEPDCRKEWETRTTEAYRTLDGKLITTYDDCLYRQATAEELAQYEALNHFKRSEVFGNHRYHHDNGVPQLFLLQVPEGFEKVEVLHKELYPDFTDYIERYHGYERNAETGQYGYWENPNRKWDWYQVGGRWNGAFKLKPGAKGANGHPSWMSAPTPAGYADSALIQDIDFEGMAAAAAEAAGKQWDEVQAELAAGKRDPEVVKYLYDMTAETTREEYVARKSAGSFSTYALLMDGNWYAQGEMGWFACSTDKMTREEWQTEFTKLLASLSPETRITVVDCHI